jgi:DNA polymerase-3 subunit delta'
MRLASGIIITQQSEQVIAQLEAERTVEQFTFIKNEDDKGRLKEFLVEQAQEAIAKAYIASENLNYIILVAPRFSEIAQNRLLKLLEEPPKNKAFILITESKSALLDTIQSRMPITVLDEEKELKALSLDLKNLNLAKVYEFVQENNRTSAVECKVLVEQISLGVMKSGNFNLNKSTLEMFSNSIKALEVGSPTSFILNGLLLKLLSRKRKN